MEPQIIPFTLITVTETPKGPGRKVNEDILKRLAGTNFILIGLFVEFTNPIRAPDFTQVKPLLIPPASK